MIAEITGAYLAAGMLAVLVGPLRRFVDDQLDRLDSGELVNAIYDRPLHAGSSLRSGSSSRRLRRSSGRLQSFR